MSRLYVAARAVTCHCCEKEFKTKDKDRKYCSRSCARKGPNLGRQWEAWKRAERKAKKLETGNPSFQQKPGSETRIKPALLSGAQPTCPGPHAGSWVVPVAASSKPLSDIEKRCLAVYYPEAAMSRFRGSKKAISNAVAVELGNTLFTDIVPEDTARRTEEYSNEFNIA